MNKIFQVFSTFISLSIVTMCNAQTISDARTNALGTTVTITGVSSHAGELGNRIRYIQDETGGLPVYGTTQQINGVNRGDSVTVTGVLKDFSGLLEIDPITSITNHGPGTEIPAWNLTIANLGETYEGRLVRIDNVIFDDAGSTFANNQNFDFSDGVSSSEIRINAGTGLGGTTIPSGTMTIVGLLSEFNGTYQLLPRDADDIFPYIAPEKKLEVTVNGTTVLDGATIQIGTDATTSIELKNIGTQTLTISSIDFTGDAAADFNTTLNAGTIGSQDIDAGDITFSTTENGSRIANFVINSDDVDNPVLTFTLYAIGADDVASEPSQGASNLQFSNVRAYRMNLDYTGSSDAEGYLVLWKQNSAPTGTPVDGTAYQRGDMVGDAKVAYVGPSLSASPRGVRADIDYHFAIYAYNGYGNFVNYNQTEVLTGNQASQGEQIGNYYNGISSGDTDLLQKLTTLINPHTQSSYFLYKGLMMDDFEVMDTTGGQSFVVCSYTAERKVFDGPFDWTTVGYSREHTYAHSWFPTHPAGDYQNEKPEYLDYHNLYPVNQNEANVMRGNLPLGIVVDVQAEYLEGKRGRNANDVLVYEPSDRNKGNAARAIFYMATAYNGSIGTGDDWSIPSNQNQDVLKQWHFQDLPDSYEIARNELIYSIQGNRNPFVDSVDFACYINFDGMSYFEDGCESLGLTPEFIENNLSVFPNPADNKVYIQLNGVEISNVQVSDMTGRQIGTHTSSYQYVELDVSDYKAGTYFLQINTEIGSLVRKVVVR